LEKIVGHYGLRIKLYGSNLEASLIFPWCWGDVPGTWRRDHEWTLAQLLQYVLILWGPHRWELIYCRTLFFLTISSAC
jgi:hypothetical protein